MFFRLAQAATAAGEKRRAANTLIRAARDCRAFFRKKAPERWETVLADWVKGTAFSEYSATEGARRATNAGIRQDG